MLNENAGGAIGDRSRQIICLFLAASMALALAGATLLSAPRPALAASAKTTDDLNLRAGPSFNDTVLTVMPDGSALTVTGDPQNGFYPVSYHGTSGWALGTYLSIEGNASSQTVSPAPGRAVTTDRLNLRAGPSLSDRVLTVMPAGATVTLTGEGQNGFAAVSYNGQAGWASTAYLQSGASAASTTSSGASAPAAGGWVTTTDLNLRAGPSTSNAILTVMPGGSALTVTGDLQNGFYPVSFQGTTGWAYAAFLEQSGGQNSSPSSPATSGSYTTQQIINIVYAAADKYGQPRADMLRVARCESNLDPRAAGGGSYGLFQFTKGTWATTPYASADIFDPAANANAAAWMWSVGRGGEWVCQ